ncbi:MAG: Crp/Fnr family transcriptional regulator [Actinobacteria bacterium]|nr:Crp/Fnr family transcriptional regulator [Actinomycetota bacterium]
MWALLRDIPEPEVKELLASAERRKFRRDEVIFHEGDPAGSVHLIDAGRVAIRSTTPVGDVATVHVFGSKDYFGEMALLSEGGVRSASAIALEPTQTIAISRTDFDRLRSKYPQVTDVLVRLLADRVRALTTNLMEALYVPADLRVLRRVVDLTQEYRTDQDGIDVVIPMKQEVIAGLAGTSRATVNRILREEEKRGSLKLDRGRVTIRDPHAISKRAYRHGVSRV